MDSGILEEIKEETGGRDGLGWEGGMMGRVLTKEKLGMVIDLNSDFRL